MISGVPRGAGYRDFLQCVTFSMGPYLSARLYEDFEKHNTTRVNFSAKVIIAAIVILVIRIIAVIHATLDFGGSASLTEDCKPADQLTHEMATVDLRLW